MMTQTWISFQGYLLNIYTKHTAKVRLLYAKKYAAILERGNAQDLLTLSNDKRTHVMKSLAHYQSIVVAMIDGKTSSNATNSSGQQMMGSKYSRVF